MGYLDDAVVQDMLSKVLVLPDVQQSVKQYQDAAGAANIRVLDIDADFVGPVFRDDGGHDALLPEDRRVRAANPELYHLVFLGAAGLDVETFDTLAEAESKLNSLEVADNELGGVIIHDGKAVAERLELKYLKKADFEEFLPRAILPPAPAPAPTEDALLGEVKSALLGRLGDLTRMAPKIGELKTKYEAEQQEGPTVIHGRPSDDLVEFARLYPGLVQLGGCKVPA